MTCIRNLFTVSMLRGYYFIIMQKYITWYARNVVTSYLKLVYSHNSDLWPEKKLLSQLCFIWCNLSYNKIKALTHIKAVNASGNVAVSVSVNVNVKVMVNVNNNNVNVIAIATAILITMDNPMAIDIDIAIAIIVIVISRYRLWLWL